MKAVFIPAPGINTTKLKIIPKQFKIGDHVRWNSEAGYVTGTIVKYITGASIIKAILIMQQKMTRNMILKVTKRTMWRHTREKHCKRSTIFNSRQSIYGSKGLFLYPDNNCRYCIFR